MHLKSSISHCTKVSGYRLKGIVSEIPFLCCDITVTSLIVTKLTHRDEVELSASEELSVTDDSLNSKTDINTTISPPPKRRNSYR